MERGTVSASLQAEMATFFGGLTGTMRTLLSLIVPEEQLYHFLSIINLSRSMHQAHGDQRACGTAPLAREDSP